MSNYKPLYSKIWSDHQFAEYSPEKKLLHIYLVAGQYVEKSGIYKISLRQISFDTGITTNLKQLIDELIAEKKIKYDFENNIIFIRKIFLHQKGMIKNKSILTKYLLKNFSLIKTDFWEDFFHEYREDEIIKEIVNNPLVKKSH